MNNQEEFVNRAWKSVEVINALNQMLREYYQMNQVNECAKDKNVRSSINTKALNNQNEGLISDAALRMLQTSGIYYNNVAPDTMLNEYMQMEVKKDSGDQSSGLSKDYLAGLYDKEVWNNIIADDYRFDHVSDMFKNDAAWGETGLSDVDFLSEYFRTTVVDTNKARFIPVEDAVGKMNVSPSSLVMSDVWPSIQSILLEDPKEIDMSSIYSMIKGLKVEYETFNENRLSNYSKLGANKNTQTSASVRPYPIHVINPFGPTFIVPDSCYNTLTINGTQVGNRPIAVQYYSSKSAKNPLYFFIVPKSFLDTLQPQYYMRYKGINIPLLVDSQGNYSLKTGFSSIGATIYTAELAASRPDASPLWNQLVSNLHWMTDRNFILYVDKPKSGKDYKSPDKPKFHQKLYVDKVQTSIDNTKTFKYKWLTWKFDGTADKFNTFVLEKKRWNLSIPSYRNLIMEVVNYLVDVQKLMYQPTDVEISLPSTDPRCIVISPQDYFKPLYEEAKKNLEINLSENPELALIQQEVDRQRARIDDLLKLMPKPSNSQNAGAPSIDVIDPDQLAKDRIKAIEEQYGVTEFNQLEDRLRDKYPVMIHPDFLDPTYFYLRELSIDYVLPASDSLAKNSISCFYSNQAFEEAFLLGMNTEMGRELMWREYPTDQRGSYFRKFWDQTELPKKEELKSKYYDIEDIDKWKGKLGNNHRAGKLPMLVFAIKGKLMQTYPDTDVYLQKIGAGGKPASEVKKQDMASWLTSDTYLVGFSGIKKEDLKNYYLVFQQKPLSLQFSKQAENQNNPYGIVNPQCYLLAAAQ